MDLRFEVDWPGCGHRRKRLLKGLQNRSRRARLGTLEMHFWSNRPGLGARAEVSRENDVCDERSILELGLAVRRLDRRRGDQGRALESRGERGPEWTLVFVRDADRRRGRRPPDQVTEQPEDDDGRDEQQGQGPAVTAELLEQPARDGGDAVPAHEGLSPASFKNASSRLLVPACERTSFGLPSASSLPYWIKPSRWQRSASSMTWLETMIVVPLAAILRKSSQNWTRSWGSTPTVGSSSSSTFGLWTSAQASEHRWRMPPLRVATTDLRRSSSLTSFSASVTPCFSAPLIAAKKSRFSSTESPG